MQIDWKSLIISATHRILLLVLGLIAAKWAFAADTLNKLMAGDTVQLYAGGWSVSLAEIEKWVSVVAVPGLVSIYLGWRHRIKAKQAVATALQLPRGATKEEVKEVIAESPLLSAIPNPAAVNQAIRETES